MVVQALHGEQTSMLPPLVSIITPSFNQGPFIQATLDSVLSQSYTHIEHIVIDGDSSDETVGILGRCDDARLRWISEPDTGQGNAINKGLAQARGDILTYLNSDDLLLPNSIALTVEHFQAFPNADLIYGDCAVIGANGNKVGELRSADFDLRRALSAVQEINQPGLFWRRAVTDRIGIFDEALHYVMDQDYWIRAALAGFELCYIPGFRAAFRLHSESKTVSQQQRFWGDWKIILDKIAQRDNLPIDFPALRRNTLEYLEWQELKADWEHGERDKLRPALLRYIKGGKPTRRVLAGAMYLDSLLGTPLTHWIVNAYRQMTGRDIMGLS